MYVCTRACNGGGLQQKGETPRMRVAIRPLGEAAGHHVVGVDLETKYERETKVTVSLDDCMHVG